MFALKMAMALLLTVSAPLFVSAARTTCDAGTYEAGKSAYVDCHFPRNVKSNNLGFNVVRYPLDSNSDQLPKTVLLCNWGKKDDEPKCSQETGITYNRKINHHLRIEILNASSNFTGSYVCNIVPPDSHACALTCNLIIKDTRSLSRQTTMPYHDQIPSSTEDTDTFDWKTAFYTTICLAIASVAVAFLIGQQWEKRQGRLSMAPETSTTSEVDGNEEDAEGDQGDQDVQSSCTGKFNAKLRLLSCPSCKLNIHKNVEKKF